MKSKKHIIIRAVTIFILFVFLNLAVFISTVNLTTISHESKNNYEIKQTRYSLSDRIKIVYYHASIVSSMIHIFETDKVVYNFNDKYIEYSTITKNKIDIQNHNEIPDLIFSIYDNNYMIKTKTAIHRIPLGKLSSSGFVDLAVNEFKESSEIKIALIKPLVFKTRNNQSEFDDFLLNFIAHHLARSNGNGRIRLVDIEENED